MQILQNKKKAKEKPKKVKRRAGYGRVATWSGGCEIGKAKPFTRHEKHKTTGIKPSPEVWLKLTDN